MSFSRAPLKRFNEHVGCAPPPGTYEIKPGDPKGAVSFDKSDRFRPVKAATAAALLPPSSPSSNVFVSPVRRTLSVDGLVTGGSSAKKERNGMPFEMKQQKLLEREIRSLVQQRGEQVRCMLGLEEELKKVEAKLLTAVREKTGLTASVITLERQQSELKKINEFLKNKVSADTTKKRINSLTMELMEARNNLDAKNQELSLLQINSEGQLKALEIDLQTARATVSALGNRNKDLEELHQVTKTQNEEIENENARLNAVIQELREEIRVLQEYLDEANDQIQELRLEIEEKTLENTIAGSQVEKLNQLEMQLEQRASELETSQVLLRQKEEEAQKFQEQLQVSRNALWEVEQRLEYQEGELKFAQKSLIDMEKQMKLASQEVQDSQATVRQQEAELARLREVLRRTERELDERVAHLEQRCLLSEEERNKTQEDGLRRIEELKMELNSLQQAKRDERKRQVQLEQEHAELTEELTKEKALVDSLTALVEQEREESEERISKLKGEMEEVLGELVVMEEQELKRQEVAENSQEVIQNLQQEKEALERQLNALLEGKSSDVVCMKELHLSAVRELQEANTDTQKMMEDVVTALESTKEDLRGAKGRQRELEAEVERLTRQLTEAMDKLVEQKEEELKRLRQWTEECQEKLLAEEKAKEEKSKILLELQVCLAQKDEEMKAAEANHAAQITQLQKELQMQINEKEEALGRLEEQRNQSLTQLQHEREEAQKVLEEISQHKAEIIKQLQEEREEKVKLHRALEEEKEALEVERKNHEQVRSEVQTLHAELQKLNEERGSLLSEVELKEFSRVLENQLNTVEQDRDQLQARMDVTEQEKVSLQAQLNFMEEKAQVLKHNLEKHRQEKLALREQVEVLTQEKVTLQWEMEEQRQELQRQLVVEVQEKSSSCAELERWKKQYEELFAKVRPFQEQLNAFAAERAALLNENGTNQEELNKLANAYASLLGHQNQKQKIKHVMKLKDENISLKQEVSKLRSLVSRQKSDLEQLKAKLPGAPRRRFDPSKAFQHDKENRRTDTIKFLKEGNHKEQ